MNSVPGMLEAREHLALVIERDEKGFERPARPAVRGQQVIRVAALGAATHDFEAFASRHVLRAAARLADVAEESCPAARRAPR